MLAKRLPGKRLPGKQRFPGKQKGTALITVVLIAAFVIVLVLESIQSIKFQKQLSSNLINRDQAYSYLMGMEELAKILLKRAFEANKEDRVHLNQPWAQDDITFPIDGGLMTASIRDMQSCFNLNSIALPAQSNNNSGSPNKDNSNQGNLNQNPSDRPKTPERIAGQAEATPGQDIFEEIISQTLENTEIQADELAISLRDWIDDDIEPADHRGAEDDYYQAMDPPYRTANGKIAHTSELLTVKGFSHKSYMQLLPFICVLPDDTEKLNVNTITEENAIVLKAALGSRDISLSDVKKALSNRDEEGFDSVDDFLSQFDKAGIKAENKSRLDVTSSYFEVAAKAEIGGTRVAMKTLFKRDESNNFKIVSRYYGKE